MPLKMALSVLAVKVTSDEPSEVNKVHRLEPCQPRGSVLAGRRLAPPSMVDGVQLNPRPKVPSKRKELKKPSALVILLIEPFRRPNSDSVRLRCVLRQHLPGAPLAQCKNR